MLVLKTLFKKDNFQMVDKYITEENVNSHFDYILKPKKIESHLTSFVVYDLETHKTDRARPYNMTFYRLGKISGRFNCDLTQEEINRCKKGTLVFDGDNCISNALDFA